MTQIKIPESWQWPGAEVNSTKTRDRGDSDVTVVETRIHLGIHPATVTKMLSRAMVATYGKDVAALILCDAAEECLK